MPKVGRRRIRVRNRELDANETFGKNSNEEILQMRRDGEFCDAILMTTSEDGQTMMEHPVHRVILAANSDYFRSMFTWPTSSSMPTNCYRIDGIDSQVLTAIIDYLYTGQLGPWLMRIDLLEKIIPAVDFLRVTGIIRKCSDYLIELINMDNVISIHRLTTKYYFPELQRACRRFLLRNVNEISTTSPDYKQLSVETLADLLGDDHLCITNESDAFEALIRWIDHDPETRLSNHFAELVSRIRFGLLDPAYLVDKVVNHRYIKEFGPKMISTVQIRPRIPTGILFAVGGWTTGNPTSFIETYDCRARSWSAFSFIDNQPRAYHGTVTLDGKIYVVGGFDGRQHFNSTRCYDPTTKTWMECGCMHYPRCYVSVCILDRKIYALGGFDGRNRINSAERYDQSTNQWTLIQNMNRPRSDASAAALNGKVYIVGGFTGEEVLNTVESYDPETNIWTLVSPMQVPRSGVSAISHSGCLLVVGGFNGFFRLASCERYNPTHDQWTYLSYMNTPRSNFAFCTLEKRVYAVGGFDGESTTAFVEEYDPETDRWTQSAPMLLERSALSACVLEELPTDEETN